MLVRDAKAVARQWVVEEASQTPGFQGAYFAGSTNWLPDDASVPATSDLDLNVVYSDPHDPPRRGKFFYRDVLLEVTRLAWSQISAPDRILGDYHLAGGLRTPSIILDHSGQLTALQARVARDYAKRQWVRRRCEHARARVLDQLDTLGTTDTFAGQVMGWLFPTGVTTHILLVAGLKNPTVRSRYVAVRELLAEYGKPAFQETLLEMLGCAGMTASRVAHHLAALTDAFDAAKVVRRTAFPFASDISDVARPIAIAGSRDLIARGLHREAVFWIAATYCRCQLILAADAPEGEQDAFDPGFRDLLGDLGIRDIADLQQRAATVRSEVPQVWAVAVAIMAANPAIED